MDISYFFDYLYNQFFLQTNSTWEILRISTLHGGWIVLFIFFARVTFLLYHDTMQGVFAQSIQFIYLAVTIPKLNEQTPRAVENFFNQLAGAHVTQDLIEKYWFGELQPWFSFEIVSIEGYLQFVIYCPKKFRDLTEAALYAQYPDAEITEIEDYAKFAPSHFPDPAYDAWGTEFTLVKESHFPILTYQDFEHKVTKEYFKDPMAALLESMSRLGKGEQFWFQIFVQPTDKKWQEKTIKAASDLTTLLVKERATEERPFPVLHRGETELVESVHRKGTKNGFKCKIRVIYIAKKENYNAKKMQYAIVGAMKQFSKDDSNGLKPLYSLTGVTGHYMFKDWQKNHRKTDIVVAYKKRSGTRGGDKYVLNVEELATIWHFPLAHSVRVPSLATAEAKRSEAPSTLPLESEVANPAKPAPSTEPLARLRGATAHVPHAIAPGIIVKSVEKPAEAAEQPPAGGAPPPNLPFA